MPINQMYRTWIRRICELRPNQRITQVRNLVWLVVGIFHSRSVQLSQIAGKVLSPAKNLSIVRRLSRFLDNPAIQVREWYEPMARQWLAAQLARLGEIRLIVDGTKDRKLLHALPVLQGNSSWRSISRSAYLPWIPVIDSTISP
jgi:hypothetical protein